MNTLEEDDMLFDLDSFVQMYEETEEETALDKGEFFLPDQTFQAKPSSAKDAK